MPLVKPFAERSRSDFSGFGSAQPTVLSLALLNFEAQVFCTTILGNRVLKSLLFNASFAAVLRAISL